MALDLRGYGETDAPSHQESYKLDCLITDIKDILDSLGRLVSFFFFLNHINSFEGTDVQQAEWMAFIRERLHFSSGGTLSESCHQDTS